MCLIVHRTDATPIPSDWLEAGAENNPDGWGVMFPANGEVHTRRGMKASDFWKVYAKVPAGPLAIHFRLATHGKTDRDNCHPFRIVGGRYAVMHNGVLGNYPEVEKDASDTANFARHVIDPMLAANPDWFGTDHFDRILSGLIGSGNKLVILRDDGAWMRVRGNEGSELDGLWLSNLYSHKKRVASHFVYRGGTTSATTLGKYDWGDDYDYDVHRKVWTPKPRRQLALAKDDADWEKECEEDLEDTPSGAPDPDDWDLDDLRRLYSFEEVSELCVTDPDFVAALICKD